MSAPILSVIIPVYNAEKYLRTCLDSIAAQPLKDMEVVMVDDGSKDSSGAICDEFEANDSRFRAIHIRNGGVSNARNTGIDNAKGRIITFIDSDDFVSRDYADKIVEGMKEVDLLTFQAEILKNDGESVTTVIPVCEARSNAEAVELAIKLKEDMAPLQSNLCYPWNKAFRRDIIEEHKLRYSTKISNREDELFVWHYLRFTERMRSITDTLYHYRLGNGLSQAGFFLPAKTCHDIATLMDEARWSTLDEGRANTVVSYDVMESLFLEARALLLEGGDWLRPMRAIFEYKRRWNPAPSPRHKKLRLALLIRIPAFWRFMLKR